MTTRTLTKSNAHQWLYSLIRMMRLAGKAGLVVVVDDGEALTEPDPGTGRHFYTPNRAKDTFEFIRQLIDDAELLADAVLARFDPDLESVMNVNSPDEYEAARRRPPAEVTIQCFGALAAAGRRGPRTVRDAAGR